jgi:hypothetical protein
MSRSAITHFAYGLGCRFLGLHWPDRRPIWDGHSFISCCRVCRRDLLRQAPGLWRLLPDGQHQVWRDLPAVVHDRPAARPNADLTRAAHCLLEALAILDQVIAAAGPTHAQASQIFAAAAHAHRALDALTLQHADHPGKASIHCPPEQA